MTFKQNPAFIGLGTLNDQRQFSWRTFGSPAAHAEHGWTGDPTAGVRDHIRKELDELDDDPTDLYEWIDLIILAFDGAMRAGHSPWRIIEAYYDKMAINKAREWPDWREAELGKAIEHVRRCCERDECRCGEDDE